MNPNAILADASNQLCEHSLSFVTITAMTDFQNWLVLLIGTTALFSASIGFHHSSRHNKAFTETPWLWWLGIFVWADAVVLGAFWFLVTLVAWWLQDWLLFLLVISIFWLVRSVGETVYWFLEQFSTITRNEPKNLWGYRWIKSEALWFLYQIFWQCVTVVTIITSLYLAKIWLS